MTITVDVPGLTAAAQKLYGLAESAQGLLAEMGPLAADPTSGGAAARLDAASLMLWGAACAQAYSLHEAGTHLLMVAAKFATEEERNKNTMLQMAYGLLQGTDDAALVTLAPVPPLPPDVRVPIPPGTPLSGEGFSQLVHTGSAENGAGFTSTATNNGVASRHRGYQREGGRRVGAGPVGKPDRHRRAGGQAQRIRHQPQRDRRPLVRARRPVAQARRRLQPDGVGDAEARGVPETPMTQSHSPKG